MSSAIRDFLLKKKDENCDLHDKRNWDTLDEKKKLTRLLHELCDSMIIRAKLVNQQQLAPLEKPPQEMLPQELELVQQQTSDREQNETHCWNTYHQVCTDQKKLAIALHTAFCFCFNMPLTSVLDLSCTVFVYEEHSVCD